MAMRGRAEPTNHNHTLYIFHKCCLSGQYFGKYNMDWNETWFIDRWQWEEGRNAIALIIPCIFIELSPLNFVFVIMDVCLGHILEVLEIKLGTHIDVNKRKCRRQEQYLTFYLSYLSLLLFIKGGFLFHILVYKWCLITRSTFYRQ